MHFKNRGIFTFILGNLLNDIGLKLGRYEEAIIKV